MRVVVTGGAGRLGRSVVRALADAGHAVTSLDLAGVGTADDPRVATVQVDLLDAAACAGALVASHPDAVVHLAAIAVPFSAPEEVILATNATLAWNVVASSVDAGARRVLAASSPTVIGYGAPAGWAPQRLPIDETHPLAPWNAYSLSKLVIEQVIATVAAREGGRVVLGAFRPCFVISPEEWLGAPTQQGHTVHERLDDPSLAAVSLFNYVDARDAADFVVTWLRRGDRVPNGSVFFVGADDALAREPLSRLLPQYLAAAAEAAAALEDGAAAFSSAKAHRLLGWRPRRGWRDQLVEPPGAGRVGPAADRMSPAQSAS